MNIKFDCKRHFPKWVDYFLSFSFSEIPFCMLLMSLCSWQPSEICSIRKNNYNISHRSHSLAFAIKTDVNFLCFRNRCIAFLALLRHFKEAVHFVLCNILRTFPLQKKQKWRKLDRIYKRLARYAGNPIPLIYFFEPLCLCLSTAFTFVLTVGTFMNWNFLLSQTKSRFGEVQSVVM